MLTHYRQAQVKSTRILVRCTHMFDGVEYEEVHIPYLMFNIHNAVHCILTIRRNYSYSVLTSATLLVATFYNKFRIEYL